MKLYLCKKLDERKNHAQAKYFVSCNIVRIVSPLRILIWKINPVLLTLLQLDFKNVINGKTLTRGNVSSDACLDVDFEISILNQ